MGFFPFGFFRYSRTYSLSMGIIMIVLAVVVIFVGHDTMFEKDTIDLDHYISSKMSGKNDIPIDKRVTVNIRACYGPFCHSRGAGNGDSDYYVVKLECGSYVAVKSSAFNDVRFKRMVETTTYKGELSGDYKYVGYLRDLNDDANEEYKNYVKELKKDGLIKGNKKVIHAVVNTANGRMFLWLSFILVIFCGVICLSWASNHTELRY